MNCVGFFKHTNKLELIKPDRNTLAKFIQSRRSVRHEEFRLIKFSATLLLLLEIKHSLLLFSFLFGVTYDISKKSCANDFFYIMYVNVVYPICKTNDFCCCYLSHLIDYIYTNSFKVLRNLYHIYLSLLEQNSWKKPKYDIDTKWLHKQINQFHFDLLSPRTNL